MSRSQGRPRAARSSRPVATNTSAACSWVAQKPYICAQRTLAYYARALCECKSSKCSVLVACWLGGEGGERISAGVGGDEFAEVGEQRAVLLATGAGGGESA